MLPFLKESAACNSQYTTKLTQTTRQTGPMPPANNQIIARPAQPSGHMPLPPSVETAYYRKCIELKRRITEVEEHNQATQLRKARLERGILKMRLERAFLLERLQERMEYNVDESDRSDSPPPTVSSRSQASACDRIDTHSFQPQEKPLRSKRSHRKGTPPPGGAGGPSNMSPTGPQQPMHPMQMSSAQSTPNPERHTSYFPQQAPAGPSQMALNGTPTSQSMHPMGEAPSSVRQRADLYDDRERDYDDGRAHPTQENGTPRPYQPTGAGGAGATGELVGAGPIIREDANGERRAPPDTEMADAGPAGFNAINR